MKTGGGGATFRLITPSPSVLPTVFHYSFYIIHSFLMLLLSRIAQKLGPHMVQYSPSTCLPAWK